LIRALWPISQYKRKATSGTDPSHHSKNWRITVVDLNVKLEKQDCQLTHAGFRDTPPPRMVKKPIMR
jgi:hypothetical protein